MVHNQSELRLRWISVVMMSLGASFGFAQITSTVHGVVQDSQSAILPGVTVTVDSPAVKCGPGVGRHRR